VGGVLVIDSRTVRPPVVPSGDELIHREERSFVVARRHTGRECREKQVLAREVRWWSRHGDVAELECEDDCVLCAADFPEKTHHIGDRCIKTGSIALCCLVSAEVEG
jgi:hypothetical protein